VTTPFNEQVMFFSLTKLSGNAATRFGLGVVKNAALATRIQNYISRNSMGPSVDIKWRSLNILRDVESTTYIQDIGQVMQDRWKRILAFFESQKRFELLSTPNTAYIYLRCLQDQFCNVVFANIGIDGIPGASFGEPNSSIYRINLTLHSYAFDLLMQKLYKLVSADAYNEAVLREWAAQLPPAPVLPEHVSEYMGPNII